MVDVDTFLTTLYVLADEFCKEFLPPEIRPGPDASLAPSEVVTLAIFGQLCRFESERSFYRYADRNLRPAFPTLPHRPQLNRLVRCQRDAITGFALHLSEWLVPGEQPFELMDCVAARTRDSRRRGPGWLPQAMRGRSNRIGWYIGFNVLTVTSPNGVITGFGFGPGNANERSLAETLFCARDSPEPRLPSAGRTRAGANTLPTRDSGAPIDRPSGATCLGSRSTVRQSARPGGAGPRSSGAASPATGRSSSRSTTVFSTRSAWNWSVRMTCTASLLAWRPRLPSTTSSSGSIASSDARLWPTPNSSTGDSNSHQALKPV
jgi:hypothetical protein